MRFKVELDKEDWEVVLTAMALGSMEGRDFVNGRVFQDIKKQLEKAAEEYER